MKAASERLLLKLGTTMTSNIIR